MANAQGGVDEGEDFLAAAFRELEEETSIKNVKLIKEIDEMILMSFQIIYLESYGKVNLEDKSKNGF